MIREKDETGVSGTGKVLEGVQWSNGMVTTHWFGKFESLNVYKSIDDFVTIHIKSHPTNNTKLIWGDGTIQEFN